MDDKIPEVLKWAGWGVTLFLLVWRFFVPRRECQLIHNSSNDRLTRAEKDIASENQARHKLADALTPIALRVGIVETEVKTIRSTTDETNDLVKTLLANQLKSL